MTRSLKKSLALLNKKLALPARVVLALLIALVILSPLEFSYAADLRPRSVSIGSPLINEVTYHEYRFTTVTSASIGSVSFEYCSNLPFYGAPCSAPAGLVVNSSSITAQSGITGLSISAPDSNANKLVLARTASVIGLTPVVIRMDNIINQSTVNQSVYIRISTHGSTDGSGTPIDFGSVVYSTASGVGVGGYVPPYLTFCVGLTVSVDCSTTDGSLMQLGELSSSSAKTSTSQFAGATNDFSGYNVYVSGGTMTAGNTVIPALTTNSPSIVGQSQFGINLASNSSPSVGASVSGIGDAAATSNYGSSNSFRYNDGEMIASSTLPTDYNRFTVSYMVNISSDQSPGIYATSFTYTAIASF